MILERLCGLTASCCSPPSYPVDVEIPHILKRPTERFIALAHFAGYVDFGGNDELLFGQTLWVNIAKHAWLCKQSFVPGRVMAESRGNIISTAQ